LGECNATALPFIKSVRDRDQLIDRLILLSLRVNMKNQTSLYFIKLILIINMDRGRMRWWQPARMVLVVGGDELPLAV
jgi:hypothetical protein